MLRNTLRDYIGEAALAALGITPTARAEDIAVADYVRLANTLADLGRR
jgi:16S rRNA (adenine1518-N6/adenine1519-N6)-dimethyltransferase